MRKITGRKDWKLSELHLPLTYVRNYYFYFNTTEG